MFSLGAVAASENITSYGGEFDSLSSIDVAEIEMYSKISNSRSIEGESILNSSYGGKVGNNNNYNLLKTDVNGGTFEDIRNAISNTQPGGTVFLNGHNYSGKNQIIINRNITIDGASSSNSSLFSVLDANNAYRIFYSSGEYHITLKNLILQNPASYSQGYFGYFRNGNITLDNVVIRNQNISKSQENAFYIYGASTLNVYNLTFANNTILSNRCNGALFYVVQRSKVVINNLNFYDNKMSPRGNINGGILYIGASCNVNIENINYYGNILNSPTTISGSFIYANSLSNISVKNWNFNNNELVSDINDGGIYINQNCIVYVDNLNFTKNGFEVTSRLSGAGLYSQQRNKVYLTNITCDDNDYALNNVRFSWTYDHRGVFIFGGTNSLINISNITFNHNNAYAYARLRGMIRAESNCNLIVDTLKFNNNYFSGNVTFACLIHTANGVDVDLKNIFIENNYVDGPENGERNQAGFIGIQGTGIISNCHSFNNTVIKAFGGIIRLQSSFLDRRIILENSSFTNTYIKVAELSSPEFDYGDHGGIVCVEGEDTGGVIRNCRFVNNYNSIGGALAPHNHCLIENCTFINNSATKYYGGAISMFHGDLSTLSFNDYMTITVKDCYFEGNTAPLGGAIQANGNEIHIYGCTFLNNSAAKGGAVFLFGNTIDIHNSTFIENVACDEIPGVLIGTINWRLFDWENDGGAVYIYGSASHLFNNTFRYNVASGNGSTGEGGAIYVHGDHTLIELTHFDDNFAYGGNGSAVYVGGFNTTIKTSEFFNHSCSRGTVYIFGNGSLISNSTFERNVATRGGGAVYIYGEHALIDANHFRDNNAYIHGGAIHTHGDYVKITHSEFYHNHAIPDPNNPDYGLGGAIYISGNHNEVSYCVFDGNSARNGSAIYNRGKDLHITDDDFLENQAFSYLLITTATPQSSYYTGSNKVLIEITLVGGDNIINAIYHDDDPSSIFFHNVTYEHSTGIRTTTDDEVHPVLGAENSMGGSVIYQDCREDMQVITLLIVKNNGTNPDVLGHGSTSGDIISDTELRTGLYGNASFLVDGILSVGTYYVYSKHPEDRLYKHVENQTHFNINPQGNLEIKKSVSNTNPKPQDLITWTITISNKGPTDSENISVYDVLPKGLIYVSDDSNGKYDVNTGIWSIGYLANGSSAVLNIKTIVNASNTQITNFANVTSDTYDPDLSNNNHSQTIKVQTTGDVSVIKGVSKTYVSVDDIIVWTITVANHGPEFAKNVLVSEVLPSGLKLISFKASVGSYSNGVWKVGTLQNGSSETLKLTTKVTVPTGKIKNTVSVTTDSYDSNKANNKDSKIVYVNSQTDLELTKQANVKRVKVGDIIFWTITVKNNGPTKAVNARVKDLILKGKTDYVGSKVSKGVFNSGLGIWIIGDLDVGESVTLILKTKALTTGEVLASAQVVSDILETDYSNNNDSDIVIVVKDGSNSSSNSSSGESNSHASKTLHAAGNPIVLVILALLAIVCVGFKRKY